MSLSLRWRLAWALRYADLQDPHTSLRQELQRFAAKATSQDEAHSPREPTAPKEDPDE